MSPYDDTTIEFWNGHICLVTKRPGEYGRIKRIAGYLICMIEKSLGEKR